VRAGPGLDDLVADLDVALGEEPHVEPGTAVGDRQRGQLRLAETQADAVAGDPGLGDLELGVADAVPVADADLLVGQAVDREVLAELAVAEVVGPEVLLPVPVGLDLVDQHGPLLAAVALRVALAVAVDVEPPDHRPARHRVLPYPRVDGLVLPGHVFRQADVHRQQHRDLSVPFPAGGPSRRRAGGGHGCRPGLSFEPNKIAVHLDGTPLRL
jgi:hypothetical protein